MSESVQSRVDELIKTVECHLHQRGILYIDRAQQLLSAVRKAQHTMALCEQTTPADFFNSKWKQKSDSLGKLEMRLTHIIKGVRVPIDDHGETIP